MAIMPKSETKVADVVPAAQIAAVLPPKRDSSVKGQVAMHAIITGYKVGANLAAAIGSSPDKIREELHKIAAEVAAKIEEYTFHD